jgi:centrin-3
MFERSWGGNKELGTLRSSQIRRASADGLLLFSTTSPTRARLHRACIFLLALFLAPVTERLLARDPMEDLRRAFALFDDDKTGKISLRNLKRVAKELGENLGEEELCVFSAVMFGAGADRVVLIRNMRPHMHPHNIPRRTTAQCSCSFMS